MAPSANPFGSSISADDIVDNLGFFDSWEDRYRYIIDLGRELPPFPDEHREDDRLVHGCQSQVWMHASVEDGRLQLAADSDAFIVKGLLALLLAAFNNRTPREVLDFDVEQYLETLGLLQHLSPSRGNGMRAMIARIREEAARAA